MGSRMPFSLSSCFAAEPFVSVLSFLSAQLWPPPHVQEADAVHAVNLLCNKETADVESLSRCHCAGSGTTRSCHGAF